MKIPAEAHSDDYVVEVHFDALPWFEQATDEEIQSLCEIEFGGNYAADAVAESFICILEDMSRLFDYLDIIRDLPSKKDCCGFECHIDREAAMRWIKENRPKLYQGVI
jgi:hypothetical protein